MTKYWLLDAIRQISSDYWEQLTEPDRKELVEFTLKLIENASEHILPKHHFRVRYALLYVFTLRSAYLSVWPSAFSDLSKLSS